MTEKQPILCRSRANELRNYCALLLIGMTIVPQIFAYLDVQWLVFALWVAPALVLVVLAGGLASLDAPIALRVRR
jgi:hypothetical protein